jgi:hypothetical protein
MATRRARSDLATIVDTTTSSRYIYLGNAEHGTATSAALWKIRRIDKLNGALIEQANSGNADQIWDNRVGLTYTL